MTIEERLEALEQKIEDLQQDILECNVIRAQRFLLVDSKGRIKAVLGLQGNEPNFGLYDEKGKMKSEDHRFDFSDQKSFFLNFRC